MPTNDFFVLVSSLFPSLLPTNICGAPTMGQGLTFLGYGHPIMNKMDKKIPALTTIYSRRKDT